MKTRSRARSLAGVCFSLVLCGLLQGPAQADEGAEPPPIPRTQPLTYYTSLVNAALPTFSSSMLTVPNGPDWMAGKTVHQVAAAMADSDPGTTVTHGSVVLGYDPPAGPRRIRLDFAEGYIRYTNRNRSFHVGSPCVAIPESQAGSAFYATVGSLGLPTSEWDLLDVDKVVDREVSGEGQDPSPETICEVERMVTLTRKAANGYPIFGCLAREAVSNLGERARLLIDWPRFLLGTDLVMRSRAEVVTDLGRQIWLAESGENGLGAQVDLEIYLGYVKTPDGFVPVARAMFADIYERFAGSVLYAPLAYNPASDVAASDEPASLQFRVRAHAEAGIALAEFYVLERGPVRIAVIDVAGREVALLADAVYPAGWHQVEWDMRDHGGRRAAFGIYYAACRAGGQAATSKILVIH